MFVTKLSPFISIVVTIILIDSAIEFDHPCTFIVIKLVIFGWAGLAIIR